ncbi:hypothetical protein GUJ93_ZPchr0263g29173 [Zizania palustris]|uniref:Uncharacterized protein n=1 Tax=Zizania palustris TaxID=103762 RepID=A0A8J5RAQ3_ZIZPA|nr:hypothetical protein GUJ93_ZPchr0263g29173 [Zizania palustris]
MLWLLSWYGCRGQVAMLASQGRIPANQSDDREDANYEPCSDDEIENARDDVEMENEEIEEDGSEDEDEIRFEGGLKLHEDLAVNPIVESELHKFYDTYGPFRILEFTGLKVKPRNHFDVVDMMFEEMSQVKGSFRQGLYYASYLMKLIISKAGNIGQDMTSHSSYLPRMLTHRHAPPSPPPVDQEEHVEAAAIGPSSGHAFQAQFAP